jgi:hypothetical protein
MKSRELLFLVLVAGAAGYLIATAPWLVVAVSCSTCSSRYLLPVSHETLRAAGYARRGTTPETSSG